jgi:hypothetical protein
LLAPFTFRAVPTVSFFFGIAITMYHNDHLPPHFHAEYQGQAGTFRLNGETLAGNISSVAARRLIREWATAHSEELEANWERARQRLAVARIEPLL